MTREELCAKLAEAQYKAHVYGEELVRIVSDLQRGKVKAPEVINSKTFETYTYQESIARNTGVAYVPEENHITWGALPQAHDVAMQAHVEKITAKYSQEETR